MSDHRCRWKQFVTSALLAVVVALSFFMSRVVAQGLPARQVSSAWSISDVASGGWPSFDIDSNGREEDGRFHVVTMVVLPDGGHGDVLHATTFDPAEGWNSEAIARGYFYGPGDLAISPQGSARALWHDHDTEDPLYVEISESGKSSRTRIPSPEHNGWDNRILFDSQNRLVTAALTPSVFVPTHSLELGVFDGDTWVIEPVVGSGTFMWGLGLDLYLEEDRPRIVFVRASDHLEPGEMLFASRDEGSWSFEAFEHNGTHPRFPDIAWTPEGELCMAWLDLDPEDLTQGEVRFAQRTKAGWEVQDVGRLEKIGLDPVERPRRSLSLEIAADGIARIAFSDAATVRYAERSAAGEWRTEILVNRPEQDLEGVTLLRVDQDMKPHVVFARGFLEQASTHMLSPRERAVFQRGDSDGTSTLEISDGVLIFRYLFFGDFQPSCLEALDADNDAAINLTDGVLVLSFLFLGGPPPVAPGPPPNECGLDPDEPGSIGDLSCEVHAACSA